MRNFIFILLSCILVSQISCTHFAKAQTVNQATFRTANQLSYNIQKYSGFNLLTNFLAKSTIKTLMKLKTKAEKINVDLKIYSGWDLIRKKARSFSLGAETLLLKDIPFESLDLVTDGPIYFKKGKEKKNRVVIPLALSSSLRINLSNVSEVLNSLPKWQKIFKELDLPLPPFGSTKIALNDLFLKIDDKGFIQASSNVISVIDPSSEPLKISFSGNLAVIEKQLVVSELQSEVEDIFTKDSDVGMSFSKMLEDLINPVFNFHLVEKNGLTIDDIKLSFEANDLILKISFRLLPEESET